MESLLKDSNDNVVKPSTSKDSIAKLKKNQNPIKTNKNKKSYEQMIIEAISTLKERNGATIPGIKKYISTVFLIPNENSSRYVFKYLKKGVEDGVFISERKFRYKLSPVTSKNIQKQIKNKVKKEKVKTKKGKENIEPKENKKNKKVKDKNDKSKTNSKKKNSATTDKKPKNEKSNIEKPKKHKIIKQVNDNNDKENVDDEIEEPIEKKVKKEKKNVKIVKQQSETKEKKTISKLKAKAFKQPTALVVAGNKLKKQARKSLIKLNMKKQKKILTEKNQDIEQNEDIDKAD